MSRGLSASVITEIAKDSVTMCHLIYLDLTTDTYITDAAQDITYNSTTYESSSHVMEVGAVNESSDVRVGSVTLTLSSVDRAYLQLFLANNFIGKQAIIYRAFLDSSLNVIGVPITVYDGRIDGYDMNESRGDSTLNIVLASHWADFEKKSGRYTNPNSQSLFFTGDKGFDFAANSVKDLKWGRA